MHVAYPSLRSLKALRPTVPDSRRASTTIHACSSDRRSVTLGHVVAGGVRRPPRRVEAEDRGAREDLAVRKRSARSERVVLHHPRVHPPSARLARASVPAADVVALTAAIVIAGVAPWGAALRRHRLPGAAPRSGPCGEDLPAAVDRRRMAAREGSGASGRAPAGGGGLDADPNWALLVPMTVASAAPRAWLGVRDLAEGTRRSARIAEPTLIVGAGEVAEQLVEILSQHPEYGLRLVGSVDADRPESGDPADARRSSGPRDARRKPRVRRVVIAFGVSERELVETLRSAERTSVGVPRRSSTLGVQRHRAGGRQRRRHVGHPARPAAPTVDASHGTSS